VLAENAGRAVPREFIIKRGNLESEEFQLKSIISRLRNNILKPMAEAYYAKTGRRPPGTDHGFIVGERSKHGHPPGPYTLVLDPALVMVQAPPPRFIFDK
jgi:hypothetical protein